MDCKTIEAQTIYGGFPLDKTHEYTLRITGFMNIAVAISAEHKANEISPELSKTYVTIKLVLNLTLRPKPNSNEYFVPSSWRKSKYDAKSFEPFAINHMSIIKSG
ncbi:hypothetical protein KAU88_03835 [Candidatus Bathyarchaeota archaeon]|nr:hypothetical protein [Candidatus Bathyarchaeota archaeon]